MDHSALHFDNANNLAALPTERYLCDNGSADSSPSPVMWPPVEQYALPQDQLGFESYADPAFAYQPYHSPPAMPLVEFTDLTAPYQEDRRRRRSQAKDKQALSSMHLRRRAQNRASQRAFRERKEQHARDLQHRLDELQEKHQALQQSYHEIGGVNKRLQAELFNLRLRISEAHQPRVKLEQLPDSPVTEDFDDSCRSKPTLDSGPKKSTPTSHYEFDRK